MCLVEAGDFTTVSTNKIIFIPAMVFDQDNNEISRDQANDFSSHIYHGCGIETHLDNITEPFNGAYTLNNFDILRQLF